MRRRSIARHTTAAALAWALALAPSLASAAADAPDGPRAPRRLVVTSRDPALVAALSAAFSPRGVKVVESGPGEAASGQAAAVTDVVWLCEPDGGGTALCVRPHGGKIVVRRISMATPLSPADAASLALSVQVALMPDEPAGALDAADAAPAGSAPAAVVAARPAAAAPGLHGLTVETLAGVRASALGSGLRAGLEAAYAPAAVGHRLGIGASVSDGPALALPRPLPRGPGPAPPGGSESDLTVRLFALGRLRLPALWLQLDVGPAAHVVSSDMPTGGGGPTMHDRRLELSADGAVGAIVPFGRFFAGLRGGASYRIATDRMQPAPIVNPWAAEGLFALGVGFM
jgi:hypothetical protein